jgi:hypothetical protein
MISVGRVSIPDKKVGFAYPTKEVGSLCSPVLYLEIEHNASLVNDNKNSRVKYPTYISLCSRWYPYQRVIVTAGLHMISVGRVSIPDKKVGFAYPTKEVGSLCSPVLYLEIEHNASLVNDNKNSRVKYPTYISLCSRWYPYQRVIVTAGLHNIFNLLTGELMV